MCQIAAGVEFVMNAITTFPFYTLEALSAWSEMRQKLNNGEIAQEEYDAWKARFGRE